jgi:hypothetical protein
MGEFRIVIDAIGGHGDERGLKDGDTLDFAALPGSSLDRVAWEAVEDLKARGATVQSATLIHWPGTPSEVTDDVLTQTRKGSFSNGGVTP